MLWIVCEYQINVLPTADDELYSQDTARTFLPSLIVSHFTARLVL